jgi:hypothetical protein
MRDPYSSTRLPILFLIIKIKGLRYVTTQFEGPLMNTNLSWFVQGRVKSECVGTGKVKSKKKKWRHCLVRRVVWVYVWERAGSFSLARVSRLVPAREPQTHRHGLKTEIQQRLPTRSGHLKKEKGPFLSKALSFRLPEGYLFFKDMSSWKL